MRPQRRPRCRSRGGSRRRPVLDRSLRVAAPIRFQSRDRKGAVMAVFVSAADQSRREPADTTNIGRREWFLALAAALVLITINAYICRDLFRNQTVFTNSMHGFWIALARRGGHGWLQSNWWPYWDCGLPVEFAYAPLIPGLMAGWAALTGIPHSLALQSITGVGYCLVPFTLFAMTWMLTRAPGYAFMAGLIYSLTSPTQLIVLDGESSWIHFRDPRRLLLMASWDDTPHVAALALLPVVILLLAAAFRYRRLPYYLATIILIALMAAASEFGPIDAAIAAICLIFALREEWRRNVGITLVLGAWAYALVVPFLPPSQLSAIFGAAANGREPGFSIGSFTALALVAVGWVLLGQYLPRWTKDWRVRFFAYFAYLTGAVPLVAAYFHRQFLPQPMRYKLEMELALAPLLVFGLRPLFQRASRPLQAAIVFLLLALAAEQVASHRRFAKGLLRPGDAAQTIEYRASAWAEQSLPGTRVMLPGSIARWANAFTDIVQFSGSSWSKALNPVQQLGVDAVYNGGPTPAEDARVSLAWLKAYGVGAVAISGPRSREYWKPYAHPAKFEGTLPVLWSSEDVTFYRVPRRTESLAHVVPREAIVARAPKSAADTAGIQRYVDALDDPGLPPAEAEWHGSNRLTMRTTAGEGQTISIQVTWHPGWHARADARNVSVERDGLGLIWLDPGCRGPCEIELNYDGGWELRLSHYLSFGVMLALVAAPFLVLMRRRIARRR
jgi:hypothetical protein